MNSMVTALELDRSDHPVEAADAYEEALREHTSLRDAQVNLVGIYFAALDGGYSAAHHLSQEFIDRSDKRLNELVNGLGLALQDTELDFWKRYYKVRVLGESWDKAFPIGYEKIVINGSYLAPYLALFLSAGGKKYELELRHLLEEVRESRTQRERELKSVVESVIRGL